MKELIKDFDLVRFVKNNEVKEIDTVLFANTLYSIYKEYNSKEKIFDFYNKNKFRIASEINEDFKLNVRVDEVKCLELMSAFKELYHDRERLKEAMNVKAGPMFEARPRLKMK